MAKPFLHVLLFFLLSFSPGPPQVLGSSIREQKYFHRPDPLRGFKLYEGGFDVRNKHYWASAAFTGVHGFAMAGIWILGGLVLGIFLAQRKRRSESSLGSRYHSHLFTALAFLFTSLVLVVSGLVIATTITFHGRARKLETTLLGAAKSSYRAINRVVHAMEQIQDLACPNYDSLCDLLKAASVELRTDSRALHGVLHEDRRLLDTVIRLIYGVTLGIISFNLVLVIAAIVAMFRHWSCGFLMVIFICWIITSVFWMLAGFHFFLHIFIKDTCSAVQDFTTNPSNNSLSSIVPCPNPASADYIMVEIGFGIHTFLTQLNSNVKKELKKIGMEEKILGFTSGPLEICDPFANAPNYSYNPSKCSNGKIPISDMINVVEMSKPLFSEGSYDMILTYAYSVQDLTNALSDLERLLHCSFLKEAFHNVLFLQCAPLKQCILLLWSMMVLLSISMMVLEVAWIAKALQDRSRCQYGF